MRVIETDIGTHEKANEILDGVIGQMSDGMFENSSYYEGYWRFVKIDNANNIIVDIAYGTAVRGFGWIRYYTNKFYNMTDTEVKQFFAKMIKRIIQQELRDDGVSVRGQFKKGNMRETNYLNYYETITIDDCVKVYEALMD